ncbi:MAG: sel1 repeat family protein, partial [Verrucomicrobia bacterium]|nr:sel1 repeat family protein [Verrucomicrobiota bacterium]
QTSEASTSLEWYEKAADLGNEQAKVQAGLMLANHRNTTDDKKAVEYFSSAAESGDAIAKYLLAECYYYGKGVVPDQKKAVGLLEEAAALQEPRAMDLLGTHYRQLHDYEKARKYYESAAALGYARSSTNLGVMYMNGEGIAANSTTAAKLFLTAAENGDAIGMFNYAYCLQTGKGVTADTQAANEWAKKSAKAGFAKAIEWCKERNISY